MSIFSKIAGALGGDLFKELRETITDYFPPDMTPQQKAEFQLKYERLLAQKQKDAQQLINDASSELDRRIAEQEGTSKDLRALPYLGSLVLFLRGAQRPTWGFATLAMDWRWFFYPGDYTEQQQTALIAINCLVLGFLFGERTLKNLEPMILKAMNK